MQCWKILTLCCAFVSYTKSTPINLKVNINLYSDKIKIWGNRCKEYPTFPPMLSTPPTDRTIVWDTQTTTPHVNYPVSTTRLPKIDKITYPKEGSNDQHAYLPEEKDISFTTTTSRPLSTYKANEIFSDHLFQTLSPDYIAKNLIYSPISLKSLLALLYIGAKKNTAVQLKIALALPDSIDEIQNQFGSVFDETQNSKDFQLNFAHNIFYQKDLVLRQNIKDIANKYFNSEVTPISFEQSSIATKTINTWVANKTQMRIQEIIQPDVIDSETQAIVVNAIYLKAKWLSEFSTTDTLKQEFYLTDDVSSFVDMMYIEDEFKYGDFPELEAKIVELPFVDTDLSMLIILPNENDGLANVEINMKGKNLNQLLSRLKDEPVTLRLPKFKIETELDMVEPLEKLGITDIFDDSADLGNFFNSRNSKVSKIQHKAYIDVNEGGVEAAAASFSQIVPLSLEPNMIYFTANHPFMFVIRSPRAIYFIGHVIKNFQQN